MDARETILSAVMRQTGQSARPRYVPPAILDPVAMFTVKAKKSYAQVQMIAAWADVPEAVLAILSAAGAAPRLHLWRSSELHGLPWHRAPGLQLMTDPPSGESAALSAADYAIAETGTLVFCSGPARASSWHFLPGREIIVLRRAAILPTLEHVLAALPAPAGMPSTLNLVTGPSRTGDIEQTMERGAHGPRHVDILIAG